MKLTYLLPIAAALLIIAFYLALPDLRSTPLAPQKGKWVFSPVRERALVAFITIVYAIVAFTGLGDREAPQSFCAFKGESALIELDGSYPIERMTVYTGIGQGYYTIDFSSDGQSWTRAGELEQGHAALLKWHEIELIDAVDGMEVSFVRITGSGAAELGEVALFNMYGEILPAASTAPLCDEQELIPYEASYLNSSYFDEIYHARTALEHLRLEYPYEVSHPPLGKLILSLGILLFGMTPFGWRFMGTLVGVAMLPIMYVFAKKLFKSVPVAVCCTIVLAADFMHFVQTRIATIDSYAVFFILLMYLFMYLFVSTDKWRYLALSGLFFGLGAASKWTCLYAGAGLAVIWLVYWVMKLYHSGEERPAAIRAFLKNILFCLVFFVAIPGTIYYLSYWPYAAAADAGGPFSKDYLSIVWENQKFMFTYHKGVDAEHPYSSRWYQWMLNIRPILYYLEYNGDGTRSSFAAFANPILCWAGFLSLFVLGYTAIFRRDKKAAFILVGYLAQLIPWMFIGRITFAYHYFPCLVFLVLSMGYVFSLMENSGRLWKPYVYGFSILCVLVFIMFYPGLTGVTVDSKLAGQIMQWLPSWPL